MNRKQALEYVISDDAIMENNGEIIIAFSFDPEWRNAISEKMDYYGIKLANELSHVKGVMFATAPKETWVPFLEDDFRGIDSFSPNTRITVGM